MSDDFGASRRHPRVALRVPVDITTIDPETDPRTGRPYFRACRELCANLSRGGLFIATDDPPGPGRRLLVRIHPSDGAPPFETIARVAWRKPGVAAEAREAGAGVEFVAESPAARAAIERMLRSAEDAPEAAPGN
jgi:Tfp pilus assembly protein PilZ